MTALLNPRAVKAALDEAQSGNLNKDILTVIVAGAEAYATATTEWGFETARDGVMLATMNSDTATKMAEETPELTVYARMALPWVTEQ